MNRIDIKLAIDMVVNAEENLFAGEADHLINTLEKCGNTLAAQAAVIGKLREAIKAVEIDSEEVLDFDEFTAMMVPMDTYHALIEALPIPDDSAQVLKAWLDSVMGEPVAAELLCKLPLTGWKRYNTYDSVKQATATMGRVEGEPLDLKVEPLFRKPEL